MAAPARGRPLGKRIRWADDTGSIALAMLLTLIGVALSSLLVPIVLTQIGSTREDIQRIHALHAAQTGLDVALGHLRAANDGNGAGLIAKLPCGPLTGRVGAGGSARYEVTIDYLPTDPRGQSDAWIAANRITCTAGSGTSTTPGYALLRSQGTDAATGSFGSVPRRSLRATYIFQTNNPFLTGGLIHVFKTTTGVDLCLDAGSATPAPGTNLQTQDCVPGSPRQEFAYNRNLTLMLVSSKTPSRPLGMCLDAGTPHAAGAAVQFQWCASTTIPQQQWSVNDSANFEGAANGVPLDGFCFNVQTPNAAGSFVVLGSVAGSGCRRGYDNIQAFSPEAAVGAGAAGAASGQLVNLSQLGRCLNVPEQDVGANSLTAWPCLQALAPSSVSWNQRWALPAIASGDVSATGRITTDAPSGLYCLRSPGSTASGQHVTVAACPSGSTPPAMTWTVYRDTGVYETSYRIVDGYGYCLSPTDPNASPPDFYSKGSEISKIVVAPCSGSTLQKWNARPDILEALPLKDIAEQ